MLAEPEKRDELDEEINQDASIFFEQTRYTTMNKLLDKSIVEFHTRLSKRELGIIMQKRSYLKALEIQMKRTCDASDDVKYKILRLKNFHLEQILDFMKLSLSKDGWRAEQLFKTLQADEKNARRFGFDMFGGNDQKND